MKIAMYGSGAAGSVFASYLFRGGADMILIDRYEKHMTKVREEGMLFTIHLAQKDGTFVDHNETLKGFRTYTTTADALAAEGQVDVIIYMTKATQLEQAVEDSLPICGENTIAVELINGLGNDEKLFKHFPKDHCLIGSGIIGTALPEAGHCVATPAENGVMMNFGAAERSELSDSVCRRLLDYFHKGECDAFWRVDDIYTYIWRKVCLNATVNVVCAVTRLKVGDVYNDPYGRWLYDNVIDETLAVAAAKGIYIDREDYVSHEHMGVINSMGDYFPSMCQDALFNKRQTEIDLLNGKIADYGEELGVPTPVCKTISQIMRCIQNNYDKQYL